MNELDERKRAEAVALLRRAADRLEDGTVPATGVVVIAVAPDVESCRFWCTRMSREHVREASAILGDVTSSFVWDKGKSTRTRIFEGVERRRANRAATEQAHVDYVALCPHECQCGKRFRSARGLAQHARRPGWFGALDNHGPAPEPEPVELGAPKLVS